MAKVIIKLNPSGVKAMLRSKEMKEICLEHAEAIRQRCGEGYKTDSYIGPNRCNASIWPASYQAKKDNSKNDTLIRAMGGEK